MTDPATATAAATAPALAGAPARGGAIFGRMNALKAHVKNGQIVLDEPTSLPEGAPVFVLMGDEADEMNDEERAALGHALDEADEDIAAAQVVSEEQMWAALRAVR